MEYLRKEFDKLSYKDKEILGGCYGVFGYAKRTLAEIGEAFVLTEDGAAKTRDRALEKLKEVCLDGNLGIWKAVHIVIRENTGGSYESVTVQQPLSLINFGT